MTALISVLVILIGLPLLAWWVGGRGFWSRLKARPEADVYREIVQGHGLRPAEVPQVEGALAWGRELSEPRLRAAVVDWGHAVQRRAAERRGHSPVTRRIALGALYLWGIFVLGTVVYALIEQRWGDLIWGLFFVAAFMLPTVVFQRNLRRAIERNSD